MELKFKALPGPWGDWESDVTVAIVRFVILKPVIISFLILNITFVLNFLFVEQGKRAPRAQGSVEAQAPWSPCLLCPSWQPQDTAAVPPLYGGGN